MAESGKKRRRVNHEEDTKETASTSTDLTECYSSSWTAVKGNQRPIKTFPNDKKFPDHIESMSKESPDAFYSLMVTDDIFQMIADCTNIFAETKFHEWIPTNHSEIKKFFSLIMFMGIVRLPRIFDYWSNDSIFGQSFPGMVLSRDRFELLLKMLHIAMDGQGDENDHSYIAYQLIDALNCNFAQHHNPTEDLFVQKGPNLVRKQQDSQTFRKDDTRLFRLCSAPDYVYKVGLFVRKNDEDLNDTLNNTLTNLVSGILGKGHTVYTDDCFTDLELAKKLLESETHLVGYIKKNRKGLPMEVTAATLDSGSFVARESLDGITIMKLKVKKEAVLLLSTKHSTEFVTKRAVNGREISKPQIIVDYEKAKQAVKLCNKVANSSSILFQALKWYKKLAFDLILNTAVVNAWTLYKNVTKKTIQIVEFRKRIIMLLCQKEKYVPVKIELIANAQHRLARKEGSVRQNRRTCQNCYKEKTEQMGRLMAKNRTSKVVTYCEDCPNQPFLCATCFTKLHQ